jgi:hypothetical protein
MSLQLRRGLDADRATTTFAEGEPVWTTDTHVLYVGDGITPGGIEVSGGAANTGDIGFQGTWIRNTGTGDIYISPQDGNTGLYIPSDSNAAGGSAVELFNVDAAGKVRIDAGSSYWQFNADGSITFPDSTTQLTAYTGGGGGSSTSTYFNLTATNLLDVGKTLSFGTGTYRLIWGQSPPGSDNQFYINGTGGSNVRLFYDQLDFVQFNSPSQWFNSATYNSTATFNSTITVQKATIGLNTGSTARSFGNGFMPVNANNMKLELPNNGGSLFFAVKTSQGVQKNVGISRQGHVILQQGALFNAFPNGVSLSSHDGGPVNVSAAFNDGLFGHSAFQTITTSSGISWVVDTYNYNTEEDVYYEANFATNGVFTVPTLSATTATVEKIKFTNSAIISNPQYNDILMYAGDSAVRINGDQGLIIGDGAGSSQIDVNQITGLGGGYLNVASVLQVGDGSGYGYITSKGDTNLVLQTSDNDGPGGSIVIGSGDGAGIQMFSGPSQTYEIANLNTFTNYLRSSQFEIRDNDYNLQLQTSNNGTTFYGNYHNIGNMDGNPQLNSQGSSTFTICASGDSSSSGKLRVTNQGTPNVSLASPDETKSLSVDNTGIHLTGNLDGGEGYTASMTGFRAGWYGGSGGYSFKNDGSQDTGMFSWGDGDLRFKNNSIDTVIANEQGWTFNQTATIQSVSIGLNNGDRALSGLVANANDMKIENLNNGGSILFSMKNPSGVNKDVAISRQGNVILANGILGNAYPNGVGLTTNDGGVVRIATEYDDNETIYRGGRIITTNDEGISIGVDNYDYGTDTYTDHQLTLNYNGTITLPVVDLSDTTNYTFDASDSKVVTLATNDTITFANFSGDILINDLYDGFVYKFLAGSGVAMMYADTNQYARGLSKTVTVGPDSSVGIEDYVSMDFTAGSYVFTNLAASRNFSIFAVKTRNGG